MKFRVETMAEKKLVGKCITMSLVNNRTFELWRSFMQGKKTINHKLSPDLYSVQVYDDPSYFKNFSPHAEFTKWAAAEVSDFGSVSEGMSIFTLPGGLYAVFEYKGLSTDTKPFEFIFSEWIPNNQEYVLDQRPHFEVLGEKYKNNDPESEEEIWVPVRRKNLTFKNQNDTHF